MSSILLIQARLLAKNNANAFMYVN